MAAQCVAKGVDHLKYLLHLAELGFIDRHQRVVEWRIRTARFPVVKSSETFDIPAIPSVNKALVMELARCEYIKRRQNVFAVGNSGLARPTPPWDWPPAPPRVSGIAIPFPPPTGKAGLSSFPPLAENGRFQPVIVVDIQAKNTRAGRGPNPQSRGPEVIALRKLRCCLRSSTVSRRGPFRPWVLRQLTSITTTVGMIR